MTVSSSRLVPLPSHTWNWGFTRPPGRPLPASANTYGRRWSTNVTVAVTSRLTVSLHVTADAHAPLQPRSVEPGSATASSVAFVPSATETEQVFPQSIPPPPAKPVPVPVFFTASMNIGGGGGGTLNPAEIDSVPLCPWPVRLIVHVRLVPAVAQAPPQPAKVAPESGVAVSVTVVFCLIRAEHWVGQSIDPLVGSGAGSVT